MGGYKKYKSKTLKVTGCFQLLFGKLYHTLKSYDLLYFEPELIFYNAQKLINSCKQVSKFFERLLCNTVGYN